MPGPAQESLVSASVTFNVMFPVVSTVLEYENLLEHIDDVPVQSFLNSIQTWLSSD